MMVVILEDVVVMLLVVKAVGESVEVNLGNTISTFTTTNFIQ
jgi:hypothetical protein